ncbi:hypothetical protein SUGI_0181360 [Cryptomeria japonica]|nr:hypothetical protein SUGI_0181360 [Cryptomeria japonica]
MQDECNLRSQNSGVLKTQSFLEDLQQIQHLKRLNWFFQCWNRFFFENSFICVYGAVPRACSVGLSRLPSFCRLGFPNAFAYGFYSMRSNMALLDVPS